MAVNNYDGAVLLIQDALKMAREDYISALINIDKYTKIKKQRKLTDREKKKLEEAQIDKEECEGFYLSDTYIKFTLGQGPKGKEVIKILQKKAKMKM